MTLQPDFHTPVLLPEVIGALKVQKNKKYIDATLGGGGYADKILELGGIVLGIDQDQDAIKFVRQKYQTGRDIFLAHGNFADLEEIAKAKGFEKVAGIIFDLGMSTYQLQYAKRGFTYKGDEVLDMRMDIRNQLTAADIINTYSRERLYEIFAKFSEEIHSGAIAGAIIRARALKKIQTTGDLAGLIADVLGKLDPGMHGLQRLKREQATKARIFQALRIEVNDELGNLEKGLAAGIGLLEPGGRIAVLSYHSLEDRPVKMNFKRNEDSGMLKIITAQIKRASWQEKLANPKSIPAKLRVAERVN